MAISSSTSWQYSLSTSLVGTTPVQQATSDSTENKYYTLSTSLTGIKPYNWQTNYNTTFPGISPSGTYAQTGGAELTVRIVPTQIWGYS